MDTTRMTEVWSEVLDRPVGPDDDFFLDIAGSSLQAVQIVVALEDELGVEVGIRAFFDHATPASLVAFLGTSVGDGVAI